MSPFSEISTSPRVVRLPPELRAACDEARARGGRVGLVPTMGALHEGHLALVREARRHADLVVVTIFVNPLQFGPGEDFDRYPRTLEADVAACARAGVDLVFAPERAAMYPDGFATSVRVAGVTAPLEGEHRPGHFDGVTTVVAKLFGLVGPCTAVFGRKDYQQWRVIARMASDLDLPVRVVGHPTVREPDGLALSSRNRYLSGEERRRALALVAGLRAAHDAHAAGERDPARLEAIARAPLDAACDAVDYVAIRDADDLGPPGAAVCGRALLAMAARVGATRLIDNLVLGEDPRP
jgi:pantoate--beta-alanine ligase